MCFNEDCFEWECHKQWWVFFYKIWKNYNTFIYWFRIRCGFERHILLTRTNHWQGIDPYLVYLQKNYFEIETVNTSMDLVFEAEKAEEIFPTTSTSTVTSTSFKVISFHNLFFYFDSTIIRKGDYSMQKQLFDFDLAQIWSGNWNCVIKKLVIVVFICSNMHAFNLFPTVIKPFLAILTY